MGLRAWGSKLLWIAVLALQAASAWPDAPRDDDIAVTARKDGGTVILDASFVVPAGQQETWAVLTDFEHMADFISNLTSSSVVSRSDGVLRVAQKGRAVHGLLSFDFDSVRDIELSPPNAIRSRVVSGSIEKLDGLTRLYPEGATTRVVYHAEVIPKVWVPPVVGLHFIEHETREQFAEIRAEVLRRREGLPRR